MKMGSAESTMSVFANRLVDDASTDNKPSYHREKLTKSVGQSIRQNLAYLTQSTGKPVHHDLNALRGF